MEQKGLHDYLQKVFPTVRILRLDRDEITTQKKLNATLHSFQQHAADILVGTQMLVKGHDFPKVTLVVVICADHLFSFPDFRAHEKAYATLKQVSGRAGRAEHAGHVIIQTYACDHPVLHTLLGITAEDAFLKEELNLRLLLKYPPYDAWHGCVLNINKKKWHCTKQKQ